MKITAVNTYFVRPRWGFVKLPVKPGLGVPVNKALVPEENKNPHNWKNPVWRHADGSVAER